MTVHTPSEAPIMNSWSVVIVISVISGSAITPTALNGKSPSVRAMARPHACFEVSHTRASSSPASVATQPPEATIRAFVL